MIVYDRILERLKDAGYSTYRLEKEKILSQCTLTNIRKGKPINTTTIDTICRICSCNPGDILKFVNDEGIGE